jgi:hypothetical protein
VKNLLAHGCMTGLLVPLAVTLAVLSCKADSAPSPRIALTAPLDFQVIQRASRTNGTLTITGTILPGKAATNNSPMHLEVRVTGKSAFGEPSAAWRPLPFDGRTFSFRSQICVLAGGWYRLDVRLVQQGISIAAASVQHVGVGEVFVIAGQSNSANYGEQRQTNHTGLVAAFDGASWRLAGDPEPGADGSGGSFMPVFGDALATKFQVPVGIVAQGIGATSVREWLPSGVQFTNPPTLTRNVVMVEPGKWEATGRIFTNFTARLKSLGPEGFRAVLWHQGESDAHQKDPTRTLSGPLYRQYLERLIRDSHNQIGWATPWFVAQASYHNPSDTNSPDLRAAQKALWHAQIALEGPDTDTLAGTNREKNGFGVHFSAAGLSAHGQLWAEKVSPWLAQKLAGTSP